MRLQRLQAVARILTIIAGAAAAAVALVTAVAVGQFALATAVLGALVLRLQAPSPKWRHIGTVGLVLSVAGVVGAAGGPSSAMLAALLPVMGDYGLNQPRRHVVLVGVLAGTVTAGVAVLVGGSEAVELGWVWALLLPPLVGVTVGQIGQADAPHGVAALESATAALDEVLALAERLPGGFDRWSVASAVHLEVRAASRLADRDGPTPHLLIVEQGVLFGVGEPIARQAVGLLADLPRQTRRRTWTRIAGTDLPDALRTTFGADSWLVHRLGGDGAHGVVLLPADIHPASLQAVAEVLRPAAVALANVHRFERLEDIANSAARVRVAHDLHDGVAQALTHVRFELDLLALEHPDLTDDIGRIRRVADAALLEVRRTVGDLRDTTPIAQRIDRHVVVVGTVAQAVIRTDVPDDLELPDAVADDVFRIVQEALSNAVRHARATWINIRVAVEHGRLSVHVGDDGIGLSPRRHRGVGLDAMAARARRLGGELTVRDRSGGGTVVELDAPVAMGQSESGAPQPPQSRTHT